MDKMIIYIKPIKKLIDEIDKNYSNSFDVVSGSYIPVLSFLGFKPQKLYKYSVMQFLNLFVIDYEKLNEKAEGSVEDLAREIAALKKDNSDLAKMATNAQSNLFSYSEEVEQLKDSEIRYKQASEKMQRDLLILNKKLRKRDRQRLSYRKLHRRYKKKFGDIDG